MMTQRSASARCNCNAPFLPPRAPCLCRCEQLRHARAHAAMLRAPALRAAEEAEADEERSQQRFLQRNQQGGAYQSGVPYPFEMRQRLLSDYDNTSVEEYASEQARRQAVANRWSVSLSTVNNYVRQREDLLSEADGGWQVSERLSKGARAKIRVRRWGPEEAWAPPRARAAAHAPPPRSHSRWTRWRRWCT